MCNPSEASRDPFIARVIAGATREELRAEFNLSSDALYRRLRRLKGKGITIPPTVSRTHPDNRRADILAKSDEGWSAKRIGEHFGLTKSQVSGIIHRARQTKEPPDHAGVVSIEKRLRFKETMIGGCRYVLGDLPRSWRWCGKPVANIDSPYCPEHEARIHSVVTKKEKESVTS